jgi:hypothetical protein
MCLLLALVGQFMQGKAALCLSNAACRIIELHERTRTFEGRVEPYAAAAASSSLRSCARRRLASRTPLIIAPPTVSGCCNESRRTTAVQHVFTTLQCNPL